VDCLFIKQNRRIRCSNAVSLQILGIIPPVIHIFVGNYS